MQVQTTNISAQIDNLLCPYWPGQDRPDVVLLRLDCTVAADLTGIDSLSFWSITIVNVGTAAVTLKHQSASSVSANRFWCHDATDRVLQPYESATIIYDAVLSAWLMRGTGVSGGGGGGATLDAGTMAGRGSASGAGVYEQIALGANLSMSGTTLSAVAAAPAATTVEVDLGSAAVWRGKFTITDAAITAAKKVLCWQAPGPYTGKGTRADEAELAPVTVLAVEPASGSAVVKWRSVEGFTPILAVPRPLNQFIPVAGSRDIVGAPQTLGVKVCGKVRGNVKFSYVVFS